MVIRQQWRYGLVRVLGPATVLNVVINLGFGWALFPTDQPMPRWGDPSVGVDLLVTTFLLTLFMAWITMPLIALEVRQGVLPPLPRSSQRLPLLQRWPKRHWLAALLLGLVALAVFGPLVGLALELLGPPAFSRAEALGLKGAYSALLTPLVLPFMLAVVLREQRYA